MQGLKEYGSAVVFRLGNPEDLQSSLRSGGQ